MLRRSPAIALPLMSTLDTAESWSIIFMAILTAAFMLVSLILAAVVGVLIRALLKKTIYIVDDNVKPILDSAKETVVTGGKTVENVRGTSTYVSESVVRPIIRAYGVMAGVRKAASVLSGLSGANEKRPQ